MPWLKWTPSETHDLTILSTDSVESFIHWTPAGSMPCQGPNCPFCRAAGRPKHRWAVEVRKADEAFTWEMSNTVYNNLCAISNKLKAFAGLQLSITRNGSGLQTTYTLIPTGTIDVSTLPPIQEAPTAQSHFGADVAQEQRRTAEAVAETIKHLCDATGLDPKVEFTAWMCENEAGYQDSPPDVQLEAFLQFLEDSTAQPTDQDTPIPSAASLL